MKVTINNLHLTFNRMKQWSVVSGQLSVVKSGLPRQNSRLEPCTFTLSKIEGNSTRKAKGKKWRGQILIIAIVFLTVVLILSATMFANVASFLRFGSNSILREQATHLAEAGVDYAIWQLNKTPGSCPSQFCGPEQTSGTTGSFIVTVQDKTSSLKTVTATGYVPNATTPRAKRTIKVDVFIASESVAFRYAVQTGTGGIEMNNNSTVNGTVYSNGDIIKGVGNGQQILGDAYATGSIDPDIFISGTPYPSASPRPLPEVDYQYWKDQAAATGDTVTCSTTCTIDHDDDIGGSGNPSKYIGNLTVSNNATVTINGPVHVTGDFKMTQGSTTIKLNNNFGSYGTTLMVGGTVDLSQGGKFEPTSSTPKGYILVVSESTNPDEAVSLSQSGSTAIFYALVGGGKLTQSANVTSLAANKLTLSNSAVLTYDTGLADAQFSTGPGAAWIIKKGTYRFTSSP